MGQRQMGRHGESGGREGGLDFCAVEASIGGRRGGGRGGWHPAISKLPTFLLRLAHVAACVSSADLYDVVPSTPSPGIPPASHLPRALVLPSHTGADAKD